MTRWLANGRQGHAISKTQARDWWHASPLCASATSSILYLWTTSVLIGLLDTADAHHARAVAEVEAADRAGDHVLAPASAYSESLVAFARAGRTRDAREAVAAMGIAIADMTQPITERAAELRAAHERLRLPDAIVLATARELGAQLLTYDDTLARIANTS